MARIKITPSGIAVEGRKTGVSFEDFAARPIRPAPVRTETAALVANIAPDGVVLSVKRAVWN